MWNEVKIVDFNELVRRFNCDCGGACNFCKHHLPERSEGKTRCAILNSLPSVDGVEVVRCKDCVLWKRVDDICGKCPFLIGENQYTSEYHFCSIGEKEEDQ